MAWDLKTKEDRARSRKDPDGSAPERFIRDCLGPCYLDIYGVPKGRSGGGNPEPGGPFVRFVRTFFQLVEVKFAPKSIARLMAPSAKLRKGKR